MDKEEKAKQMMEYAKVIFPFLAPPQISPVTDSSKTRGK